MAELRSRTYPQLLKMVMFNGLSHLCTSQRKSKPSILPLLLRQFELAGEQSNLDPGSEESAIYPSKDFHVFLGILLSKELY